MAPQSIYADTVDLEEQFGSDLVREVAHMKQTSTTDLGSQLV